MGKQLKSFKRLKEDCNKDHHKIISETMSQEVSPNQIKPTPRGMQYERNFHTLQHYVIWKIFIFIFNTIQINFYIALDFSKFIQRHTIILKALL